MKFSIVETLHQGKSLCLLAKALSDRTSTTADANETEVEGGYISLKTTKRVPQLWITPADRHKSSRPTARLTMVHPNALYTQG